MQRRPLTWFLASLLLFVGAVVFWRLGDRWAAQPPAPATTVPTPPRARALDTTPRAFRQSEAWRLLSAATAGSRTNASLRLTNARHTPSEWTKRPTAILLENALIDTAVSTPLGIPEHLQTKGDPGTYVVQARGKIDEMFRAELRQVGAEIVSYIPNNAYLVRLAADGARQLATRSKIQAVLPFEPYYKLKTDLLRAAVDNTELALGERLNVALFADAREATLASLQDLGAKIMFEEPSPFGPVVTVEPLPDSLVALAALPGVQVIETATDRVLVNDLSRARVAVATDAVVTNNWLDLTGSNVLVNVNDSGVDATHPDLVNRMFSLDLGALTDDNGHGTHVIGTIAGDGTKSDTVTNASGSIMPGVVGQFRGAAPGAKVFVMALNQASRPGRADADGTGTTDSYFQESAARTNAFISNNSWHYGGNSGYSLAAARYDAATRDALPRESGSQPLLFVFAAGNSGGGSDRGDEGYADTIGSPGAAKNVITVGALEQIRNITNEVINSAGQTNKPWLTGTDADNEVAAYSSRGNVGVGVEGEFGRFKPDVVAPGSWVVSTRSATWDEKAYFNPTNYYTQHYSDLRVKPGQLNNYSIFLPYNAVGVQIQVLPNEASPKPFPDMPIYVRQAEIATTNTFDFVRTNEVNMPPDNGPDLTPREVSWNYSVGNNTSNTVWFDLRTVLAVTNDVGNEYEVRSNMNHFLCEGSPKYYRYESGTSMAAPQVAGVLALMQELFEQRLGITNSPALMKALLINGARSAGPDYDFQVKTLHNYQGWGLVNVPTTLPADLTNYNTHASRGLFLFDQSPTNALATGQRHVRTLKITDEARTVPLRVTLVWTDPPGNPVAGVKLVNDLDLVVTNLDTGTVYYGNNITMDSNINEGWDTKDTNSAPNFDVVNNVENVFLPDILGTNYAVAVIGSHVNVNAVNAHTNDVVQDYALVISSGDGDITNAITLVELPGTSATVPNVTYMTNMFEGTESESDYAGGVLMGQHVGANTPLMGVTNGMTNQWHFYVLTNTSDEFKYAAFVTFLPPTLAIPRMGVDQNKQDNATRVEADIDLYVSRDFNLTNLDPVAISGADKSRGRLGTEILSYSNATAGVYYVGIKSEDQMASEYGFLGIFSRYPFSDETGNLLYGFPVPTIIPDGSPNAPGAGLVFAVCVTPTPIRRVIVTNTVTHERFGDLVGSLSHNGKYVVLNNHTLPEGNPTIVRYTWVYEDNGENNVPSSQGTDGPGSLRDFVGEEGVGLWLLQMADNALTQTGRVERVPGTWGGPLIRLEPQDVDETGGNLRTVPPYSWTYDFIDVPVTATNLIVCVLSNTLPMELYVRRGDFPTRTEYDKMMVVPKGGGCMTLNLADLPPLTEGRYVIGVYNPNSVAQTIRLTARLELGLKAISPKLYTESSGVALIDDAVTNLTQFVTNDGRIASVEVGLRIDHPRVSDLAVTLVSPKGTRVLLTENRGWTNQAGFGSTYVITNMTSRNATGDWHGDTNIIDLGVTYGSITVNYEFFNVPDTMHVYYDDALIYTSGMVSGSDSVEIPFGPGPSTEVTVIINQGNSTNLTTEWEYTVNSIQTVHNYLMFTENTNMTSTPIKFVPPPYTPFTLPVTTLLSGFEPPAAGDYFSPQTVDGWSVLPSDPVTVLEDILNVATNANTGVKSLALRSGEIQRTLPTTQGRDYRLQYAYRRVPFLEGIVSWWPGEGSGTDIVDGNDGTLLNGVTYTNGIVGRAFSFDGVNDYVMIGDSPNLRLTNALTIEGWLYPSNFDRASNEVLSKWDSATPNQRSYTFKCDPTGRIILHMSADGGSVVVTAVTSATALPLDQWTHVAGTYDGQRLKIYVNGVFEGETLWNRGIFVGDAPVIIGSTRSSGSWFAGRIDELTLYKRALTANEIQQIFAAGAAGKCWMTTPPSLCLATCAQPEVDYPNFNSTAGLALIGDTLTVGGTLRLTSSVEGQVGNAWLTSKQPCFDGFDTRFKFRINTLGSRPGTPLGADGIAFALQNVGPAETGAPWGAPSNYVTVMLNTFLNWPGCVDYENCDVSDNSAGIVVGGKYIAQTNLTTAGIDLSDGNIHEARIVSDGLALTLWLDQVEVLAKVAVPDLKSAVDGAGEAWVGFGASTGWAWENHDILDWTFCGKVPNYAAQIYIPNTATNIFVARPEWRTNSLFFTAVSDGTLVGLSPTNDQSGTLLDTFVLTEYPGPVYVLPEESLKALADQNPYGTWTLEILDTRTGATNVVTPEMVSWQLRFIFQNDIPVPGVLVPGEPVTNTVPAGRIAYYVVDVPAWAKFATNMLYDATGRLNLWFNQDTPPMATNAADYLLLNQVTSGAATLFDATTPPLQPGIRYYLGVQNTNAVAVTYTLAVDFDIITLTNGIPFTNLIAAESLDRYRYWVTPAAARVQYEINGADGNLVLVARKGLPVPDLALFDYVSANTGTNDELIVVFTNSSPVTLSSGYWYLSAVNPDIFPVHYAIKATEWPVTGQPVVITNWVFGSNAFCLTWTSLAGVHYHVDGLRDLNSSDWKTLSPTITATGPSTTWCLDLPSEFHFFRVAEGLAVNVYLPQPIIDRITRQTDGILLEWKGPTNALYQVEWTPEMPAPSWNSFTNLLISTNGQLLFLDDGSQTSGFGDMRFYRVLRLP